MTDVDTLWSQLFPAPLVNKSLYDVMTLRGIHVCLAQLNDSGLVSLKNLNPKACLQTQFSHSSRFLLQQLILSVVVSMQSCWWKCISQMVSFGTCLDGDRGLVCGDNGCSWVSPSVAESFVFDPVVLVPAPHSVQSIVQRATPSEFHPNCQSVKESLSGNRANPAWWLRS